MKNRNIHKGETLESYKKYLTAFAKFAHKNGKLNQVEISGCKKIGIDFRTNDERWLNKFDEYLKVMPKSKPSSKSVSSFPAGSYFRRWELEQKRDMRTGKLDAMRIDKLNSIGFIWNNKKSNDRWTGELNDFRKNNNRNPSSISKEPIEFALAYWRNGTGRKYLKKLGIYNPDIRGTVVKSFEERLEELRVFEAKSNRPPSHIKGDKEERSLGGWRVNNKVKLKELGFHFKGRKSK